MRIAIVGGQNFRRYSESISKVENVEVYFHDGIPKRKNKKCLARIIRDADYVIIVQAVSKISTGARQHRIVAAE
ncbi:hypothetical protein [Desulfitobacterium sp. AusDCA]|uniref:hypothetical protein n=1 Tax=Desulfitobacterium sp. AusDCA TaxID=3240383 RepID=UPI003DA789B7